MGTTFVINTGSTSRKYALYRDGLCQVVLFFETTGKDFRFSTVRNGVACDEEIISAAAYEQCVKYAVTYLVNQGDIASAESIQTVAVRVVAPGSYFTQHRLVDEVYMQKLEAIAEVAPLHTPGMIAQLQAVAKILPKAKVWGVSDSAFHTTIPKHIRTISIPKADAQQFDIERFGYHGLSFASIASRLESQFGEVPKRTIVCHIGGGVSIAALRDGKSVSTSMGYSPVSGVMMGSRGGDITAGVVAALTVFKKLQGKELYEYLYTQSGFKGVAGVSDLRLVLERSASKDEDAQLALDMFAHEVRSWIGAHVALLGGVDAVVLTATASVRNPEVRKMVLSGLECFGIKLDANANDILIGKEGLIHSHESSVEIAVMKTDEMGEIYKIISS